jgi:hypothetical protein
LLAELCIWLEDRDFVEHEERAIAASMLKQLKLQPRWAGLGIRDFGKCEVRSGRSGDRGFYFGDFNRFTWKNFVNEFRLWLECDGRGDVLVAEVTLGQRLEDLKSERGLRSSDAAKYFKFYTETGKLIGKKIKTTGTHALDMSLDKLQAGEAFNFYPASR